MHGVRGRVAFGLTVGAVVYGVALLVWVVASPNFQGQTLLEYGGPWSLAITSQPVVLALGMWWLLHRRCSTGSQVVTRIAWWITIAFLLWSVLGALSLAAGAFPAAVLLLGATALTPAPQPSV